MKWVALVIAILIGSATRSFASEAGREPGPGVAADMGRTTIKSATRKIDVNAASVRELQQLPGIGPELAERVVRHRPYQKLDELIARKVLGRKEFARIKERIRVNPAPESKSSP